MRSPISIIVLLVTCSSVFSQNLEWSYKFGGSYEDMCYDVEIDSLRSIYLTGGICNSVNFNLQGGSEILTAEGSDQSDIFVVVYDANMVLKKAFVLNGNSWDYATDIEIDRDNNIYISGFYSGTIDFNPSQEVFNLTSTESKYFVAKYDSIGNFKWAKNISRKKDNWGPSRSILHSDINSNIYLSTPDTLFKLDLNGDVLWPLHTNGFAVFDEKSNFYTLSNSLTPWDSEMYSSLNLIKMDTSGNVLFDKEIISNSSNSVNGFITFDKSGKLLINGDYWGETTFNGKNENIVLHNDEMICCMPGTSNEYPGTHEYFTKFDTTGNVIWAYDFGSNNPNPYLIETTIDGTIYSLGFLNFSSDFDHTDNIALLTNSGYGNYIAKYDSSCNFLAATEFMGGSYNDFIGEFKILNDFSAYITGHFFNTIDLDLSESVYTLYTNPPEDNFIAKYSEFDIEDFTSTNDYQIDYKPGIKLYPNPSNNHIYINNSDLPIDNISLLNINGQTQLELSEYDGSSIDISHLTKGLYIVQMKIKDKIVFKKLIKE